MSLKIESCHKLLLKNARVIDPQIHLDSVTDILIEKDSILEVGIRNDFKGKTLNCEGKIAVPGLVDMHVHLREPGQEHKETIETGCNAAAAGGFTEVCCMPNTSPPIDCRSDVEFVLERARGHLVQVHPVPAVTLGMAGEKLTEMGDMVEAGAVAFSDDGKPVLTASVLRRALEYAKMFGCPIIDHCEDLSLSEGGVMHEGRVSTVLGMPSIPSISEEVAVARDLLIAEYTGGKLHIAHVSTAGSVRLIREAKARGVNVTAETCPHYLVLTDEAVRNFDTFTKMNPPLRSESDREALIGALKDGTIDVIATDHAPHAYEDKECEFRSAAFGIVGLETALGLIWTHHIATGTFNPADLVDRMAVRPRKILGLPEVKIEKGCTANLTVIDPGAEWTVDSSRFQSKSRNTPFNGWKIKGRSFCVINQGKIAYAG